MSPLKKNLAEVLAQAKESPLELIHIQHPKSREGKKAIIAYLDAQTHRALKMMAAQNDTTLQELSEKAYGLLLKSLQG